jgi:hypothetical protein
MTKARPKIIRETPLSAETVAEPPENTQYVEIAAEKSVPAATAVQHVAAATSVPVTPAPPPPPPVPQSQPPPAPKKLTAAEKRKEAEKKRKQQERVQKMQEARKKKGIFIGNTMEFKHC